MVKQYTENQYDDDLTVGTDEYDDSYYTGSVDLFEFSNDEESPISRLKSLVLSIDWEITDEILMQFNEELVDLREIWAGEKINLVYVQALEKISKYIYQKKADSHPSAIKLLLTLYHNLEKIVSSLDLTDDQKKEILLEDVKRFESLKRHIAQPSQAVDESPKNQQKIQKQTLHTDISSDLLKLKAIVLGIDWEITDQDLSDLRQEVIRLEGLFAGKKPRLILLQGIGTLGAYIKLKKSNAHADAFQILHLFYESLEKIVTTPMELEEEKAILFPAVEKFNSFKKQLGSTVDTEVIKREESESDRDYGPSDSGMVAPAFADFPEEEIGGFQAENEAQILGLDSSGSIDNQVESFFTDHPEGSPGDSDGSNTVDCDLHERALQGVDVETDDDEEIGSLSDEEAVAPALSDVVQSTSEFSEEASEDDEHQPFEETIEKSAKELADNLFSDDFAAEAEDESLGDFSKLDKDKALQGVDVETEADDDSDEDALPLLGGELAPALAANDEVSLYNEGIFEHASGSEPDADEIDEEIEGTLGGFFDEEIESHLPTDKNVDDSALAGVESTIDSEEVFSLEDENGENLISETDSAIDDDSITSPLDVEKEDIVLQGVDVETEADDDSDEEALPVWGGELAPALAENDEVSIFSEESSERDSLLETDDDDITGSLGGFFDDEIQSHPSAIETEDDSPLINDENPIVPEDETAMFVPEVEEEENLDSSFDDSDFEENMEEAAEDDFFAETSESDGLVGEEKENNSLELDEQLDDFFEVKSDIPEEVVFELVEESDESDQAPAAVSDPEVTEEASSDEFVSAEEDLFSSNPIFEDEEIEDLPEDFTSTFETEKTNETYTVLQTCVDSLGIELDNKVILGLWEEIDHLQKHLAAKPLELNFLQLITTVTRHIDQNRYDSSSYAYGLLQSICSALTDLLEDDVQHNLEMLLTETRKVLNWQEDILAQQAAKNEAELTIGDPMSSDLENMQALDQEDSVAVGQLDKSPESLTDWGDTKMLTDDLKQEISSLRQTLQNEIAELRKELKGNSH